MIISAKTDIGAGRDNNEDCYAVKDISGGCLAVLCDGMGGHAAGEVASKIATESIVRTASEYLGGTLTDKFVGDVLSLAVSRANDTVYASGQSIAKYDGMGTTAVIAYLRGARLYTASIGDSRIYRCREGKIRQLTKDHSLAREMLDKGLLTPEEYEDFTFKNVITRCIGSMAEPLADTASWELYPGDSVLLCSDGLSDVCSDEELAAVLTSDDFENTAAELIELALKNGSKDNITVIAIKN